MTTNKQEAEMTVKEFAERAEISESLAYELIAEGSVPHRRIGRKGARGAIRISDEDYAAWAESTKVPARKLTTSGRR